MPRTTVLLLSLLLLPTGCGAELNEVELTTVELAGGDYYVPNNGISNAQLIGNDIISKPDNLDAFISNPLDTASLAALPVPFELFARPTNRTFVRYTVECALQPEQQVAFDGETYKGMLGICPSWHETAPTTSCLEAVSACLLGRENKVGRRVSVSGRMMRTDGTAMSVTDPVPADSYFQFGPYSAVQTITSFGSSCSGPSTGELRNCRWKRDDAWVGLCAPGADVSVGVGGKVGDCGDPLGESFGEPVMRSCAGWNGCNTTDGPSIYLGSAHDTCVYEVDGNEVHGAALDFTCPPSGVFSVMLAGYTTFGAGTGIPEAESNGPVTLVATVDDAFTINEGTFWGNLFKDLNPNVTVSWLTTTPVFEIDALVGHTGINDPEVFLFEDAWICHDPRFLTGAAYSFARLCTDDYILASDAPNGMPRMCSGKPLGPCNTTTGTPKQCNVLDTVPTGDKDRDRCIDGNGQTRAWPMTVFLRGACDLLDPDEADLCRRSPPGGPRHQ